MEVGGNRFMGASSLAPNTNTEVLTVLPEY
jgi:hypothetical protein